IVAPGWHTVQRGSNARGDALGPWEDLGDDFEDASESLIAATENLTLNQLLSGLSLIPGPIGATASILNAIRGVYVSCDPSDLDAACVQAIFSGAVSTFASLSGLKAAATLARAEFFVAAQIASNGLTVKGLYDDENAFDDAIEAIDRVGEAALEHQAEIADSPQRVQTQIRNAADQLLQVSTENVDYLDGVIEVVDVIERLLDDPGGQLDPNDPDDMMEIENRLPDGPPPLSPLPPLDNFFDVGDTINTAAQIILGPNSSKRIFERIGNNDFANNDVDIYGFFAQAGDFVEVNLRRSGPDLFRSHIRLFNQTGGGLTSDTTSGIDGNPRIAPVEITADGFYFVGVSGYPNTSYSPLV
ncbi:MAG: hypothetical protein QGF59_04480, partial [Pirellulaceae bacterium]|nr:hypothetical protein [Pirellulaceae bacterium]